MRVIAVLLTATMAMGAVALGTGQSMTGTGYEWQYVSVWGDSTYKHPVTGKGMLPAILDNAESVGWELRHIELNRLPGETLGKWEMVFRAPTGSTLPQLPAPPGPPPPPPPPPGPTAGGTNCPLYPIAPFPGALCYSDGGWRP